MPLKAKIHKSAISLGKLKKKKYFLVDQNFLHLN